MISRFFEPYVKPIQDDETLQAILRVVREANQELVLVSPYNNYPGHLERAVKEAIDRKIPITVVCRENHRGDSEQKERHHWEALESLGAEVHLVKDLHSKIYYNESLAIVTSMNLHTSSASNSREFGFLIRDPEIRGQIRAYVQNGLVADSTRFTTKRGSLSTEAPRVAAVKPATPKAEPKQAPAQGLCIRCGEEEITYNPDAPLCRKCYGIWKVRGNRTYPENYCHHCRKKRKTSFARPLCSICYKKAPAP